MKFHDNRCQGKVVMHCKPFSVIHAVTLGPHNQYSTVTFDFLTPKSSGKSLTNDEYVCAVS